MKDGVTGAQGAKEFFLPLRILTAIIVLNLTLSVVHAQGNSPAVSGNASNGQHLGLNQQVQLEGELEIIHQDFRDGRSRNLYSLKTSDGSRVPLQFTKEPPTHLLTGDHVVVSGQRSGGSLVLYSGSTSIGKTKTPPPGPTPTPTSIPVPNTFGAQSTLVMLVNFQDGATQPYTTGDAFNAFFGSANNFVMENSYGQTSITGDVVGWYTIPDSITACNISQIAADAQSAATAAGVNLSNYTRYVYAFPYSTACGWAGSSNVGGNPSQSWINDNSLDIHIIDHELGHAFGLWHSHSLDCGTSATICSSGTVAEYGDRLDTMGTPQTASPHYNAYQKERLGWLNYGASPSIQTVTGSGTYTINPYELGGAGPNALKILKSTDATTGAKTWYYLEARQPSGFDAFLADPTYYTQNETIGVLFHIGTDGNGNTGQLLDMTPATPTSTGWFDASLGVGQSFQDSTAGVNFTTTAVNSAGATVQVTVNGSSGSSCTTANPSVSFSPAQGQPVTSGTAVSFTATVTDNDNSSCAASTFALAAALPSGWNGVWNATALSLSPGKSGSAILTVTSPAGTADGSYSLSASATNSGASSYTGSATATYVISSVPLSISLATNQSSYLPGQTVAISVSMLYGTVPDAGASVTVNVVSPSGRATTLNGTTGSNGVASLNYKLANRASAGTYQVQFGSAAKTPSSPTNASSAAVASTSFTVQ